jgi:protocatechuate 3,4-dioxygenase beta subunit
MSVATFLAFLVTFPLVAQAEGRQLDGSVVDDQGKPVARATVTFRHHGEGSRVESPAPPRTETDSAGRFHLAIPKARTNDDVSLAVTTGADGKATFNFVARLDQLAGVYVTTRSTGRQYFPLRDQPSLRNEWTMTTIRIKPTTRLVGTLNDAAGKGVSGQPVEVWQANADEPGIFDGCEIQKIRCFHRQGGP